MFTLKGTAYGDVVGSASLDELRRYVDSTGSHFFDRDTMRFFGTRNLVVIGGVVVVGTDRNAPEGYPRVWGRVFTTDGGSEKVTAGTDRRTVIREAHRIADQLKEEDTAE